MMSAMTGMDESNETRASTLCRSCGLCCTGHLFIWAKLRPSELDPAEALGMRVFRSDPTQRGFSHPCPLWQGDCTIHASPHYPHVCRAYQCNLLKEMLGEDISLPDALETIERAKGMIQDLEALLPVSSTPNFRERLMSRLENPGHQKSSASQDDADWEFQQKAGALLVFYEQVFGVLDMVEKPGEE
jgi:uncharacterized protein